MSDRCKLEILKALRIIHRKRSADDQEGDLTSDSEAEDDSDVELVDKTVRYF